MALLYFRTPHAIAAGSLLHVVGYAGAVRVRMWPCLTSHALSVRLGLPVYSFPLHTFISRYRSRDHPILGLPANTDGQISFRTNLDETPVLTGETGGPLCVPPVGRKGSTPSESSCTLGLNANGVTKMPPPLGQSATLFRTETGSSSVISTRARKHVRFARSRTAKGPHHTNTVQALVPSAVSSINVDVRRRG